MEIKSLKHNFIMYFFRTFFNLGFVLFIFPIVTRKLGAENLGKIQYVETIVAYFLLFINLGIDTYGKREVALYRENKEKLEKIVSELLTLLLITTLIGLTIYILFIKFFINDIALQKILSIFSLNIALNFCSVEWFYLGIENQSYITKRNIFFKIVSAILIFNLIKSKDNIYIYSTILVFSLVGSNILNILNLKKYVVLHKIEFKNLKKHLKQMSVLFFSVLALSIAYNLDSLMIKNIVGDKELGYYSFAMKFGKMPLIFPTAIVTIFYPRLCNLLSQQKKKEYYQLSNLGIEIILLFSIPASVGMFILSESIVKIFAGTEFIPSIKIMKIFSIYIFVMGIALSTGSMTLLANKRDKIYSLSVISGAILNFIFNLIFIHKIGAFGAAIASLITEIIAIIIRIIFCRDIFRKIKVLNFNLLKILGATIFMGIEIYFLENLFQNLVSKLIISTILGGISYIFYLILFHEKNIYNLLNKIKIYSCTRLK